MHDPRWSNPIDGGERPPSPPPAPPPVLVPPPVIDAEPLDAVPVDAEPVVAPPPVIAPPSLAPPATVTPPPPLAASIEAELVDASPAAETPLVAEPPTLPKKRGWRRVAGAWTISMLVHEVLIVALGLYVYHLAVQRGTSVVVIASMAGPTGAMEEMSLIPTTVSSATLGGAGTDGVPITVTTPPELSEPITENTKPDSRIDPQARTRLGVDRGMTDAGLMNAEVKAVRSVTAPEQGVGQANGVAEAVDGVIGSVRGELDNGDLLVVWLLDASLSLVDDRQQIAERIEPFYREIQARDKRSHYQLMNSVVAYGGDVHEVLKRTPFGLKVVEAVKHIPIDQTGLENVMSAVEWCVAKERKSWKKGMMIVVWTDESGDDILRLEDVAAYCRHEGVAVSIIGPTAVLGAEKGMHNYTDKESGYRFLLPIKRGPDTSLPERIMLPYWHESALRPWSSSGGAMVAQGMPWYGGPHREGLLSGVGSYALTRLALQTGGTYTILDRAEDRGPFRIENLREYLPDYGSAEEYVRNLKYHPLRQATSNAVMRTYQKATIMPPAMHFVAFRFPYYPFSVGTAYLTASEFRSAIKEQIPAEIAETSVASAVIEDALMEFGPDGMEGEYEREKSKRWRAWYDLTRGRLLAASVRYLEYRLACEAMLQQGTLNTDTNHVRLNASSQYRSPDKIRSRALEARRLLDRCIEANPETPWAMLAEWELANELGLTIDQIVIPPPQPVSFGSSPPPSRPISFPRL